MEKLLNHESDVIKCLKDSLGNPVFCDVKLVASDGDVPANKTILSIRSHYFCSMFSGNNNFVESQTGVVKMPYRKSVLEKVVGYLYTGKIDWEDLILGSQLDLLDLLNLTNLPEVFGVVEEFTVNKIKEGDFSLPDCLRALDHSSRLGIETVGLALLTHLGKNFDNFSQDEAVGTLSGDMIARLLEEGIEVEGQNIFQFRTLVSWLSYNGEADRKEDLLKLFSFDNFTVEELATDVRKSELYEIDQIIKRMAQLYQILEAKNKAQEEAQKMEMAAMKKKIEEKCLKKLAQQEEKIKRESRRKKFSYV